MTSAMPRSLWSGTISFGLVSVPVGTNIWATRRSDPCHSRTRSRYVSSSPAFSAATSCASLRSAPLVPRGDRNACARGTASCPKHEGRCGRPRGCLRAVRPLARDVQPGPRAVRLRVEASHRRLARGRRRASCLASRRSRIVRATQLSHITGPTTSSRIVTLISFDSPQCGHSSINRVRTIIRLRSASAHHAGTAAPLSLALRRVR